MKRVALLLLSICSLAAGLAHAERINPRKEVICGLSGAKGFYLSSKKALISNGQLSLVYPNGEVELDQRSSCRMFNGRLECSAFSIGISIDLESGNASVDERQEAGAGSRGRFLSGCKNL